MCATIVENKGIGLRNSPRAFRKTLNDTVFSVQIPGNNDLGDYFFSFGAVKTKYRSMWLVDSGATQHIDSFKGSLGTTRNSVQWMCIFLMTVLYRRFEEVVLSCQ